MWKTFMLQGWRNLRRNARRTTITVLVVAVGLTLMIVSYGLIEGFVPQMIEGGARTLNGHILIQKDGYFSKKSLDLAIKEPSKWARWLDADPRIEGWSMRLLARGLLGSAEGVQGVRLLGTDPERDSKMITLYSRIIKGRAPRPSPQAMRASRHLVEVLIGKKIAHKLRVDVGSKVVLKVGTYEGGAADVSMRVSGIFSIGSPAFDGMTIVIHRKDADNILQMKGQIHQIVVRVKQLPDVKAVVAALQTRAKTQPQTLEILPWWETAPEVKAMVDMSGLTIWIMVMFIFPIVLLGCLNTMLMSAYERSREIGILKALGTRRGQLIALFFWEGLFISLVGVGIGLTLGLGLNLYFEANGGISLRMLMSDDVKMMISGVALDPVMWVKTTLPVILVPCLCVILSTVLAALYPAWKVSKLEAAKAIQFQ